MIRPGLRLIFSYTLVILWTIGNYLFYRYAGLSGLGLRYLFAPWVLIAILLLAGVGYVKTTYELASSRAALRYTLASLFGLWLPVLVIQEGAAQGNSAAQAGKGQGELILKMGGPGRLVVHSGSVVLLESQDGKLRVVGAGQHAISRFESVKEIAGLGERVAHIEQLSVTTKDGIDVMVRDIRYRYRLCAASDAGGEANPRPDQLFSYSEEAVKQMSYNRPQIETGISSWHQGVNQVVEAVIADYLRQHPVDRIVAPKDQGTDVRSDIYHEFYSENGVNRFRAIGAALIWIDIGYFETPEKTVIEQRVSTWQAKWLGNADIVRASGEAQRAASQELGRAEAQAEMLKNIVHSLESLNTDGEARRNIRALYLTRIAQWLDAMNNRAPEAENSPSKESPNL